MRFKSIKMCSVWTLSLLRQIHTCWERGGPQSYGLRIPGLLPGLLWAPQDWVCPGLCLSLISRNIFFFEAFLVSRDGTEGSVHVCQVLLSEYCPFLKEGSGSLTPSCRRTVGLGGGCLTCICSSSLWSIILPRFHHSFWPWLPRFETFSLKSTLDLSWHPLVLNLQGSPTRPHQGRLVVLLHPLSPPVHNHTHRSQLSIPNPHRNLTVSRKPVLLLFLLLACWKFPWILHYLSTSYPVVEAHSQSLLYCILFFYIVTFSF